MNIILCTHPSETREAATTGLRLCHLAYRVGADGRLLRNGLGVGVKGGMLCLSDDGTGDRTPYDPELLQDIKYECVSRGFDGVVFDFERGASAFSMKLVYEASQFLHTLGYHLYVPEAFAGAGASAQIMISSGVHGGSCEEHYRRAARRYKGTALVYDPVCIDFQMPSPRGREDFISRAELSAIQERENAVVFFSRELCSNYFTYRADSQSRFVMFDDKRSMLRKLEVAKSCGIETAFLCPIDVRGCLSEVKGL